MDRSAGALQILGTPDYGVTFASYNDESIGVDTLGADRHNGSQAIRSFILETQPILALSGHIHEAITTDTLQNTILINPGPFHHGRYAYIEIEDNTLKTAQLRSL